MALVRVHTSGRRHVIRLLDRQRDHRTRGRAQIGGDLLLRGSPHSPDLALSSSSILLTEEGIVGRSYLEPYVVNAMRYLVPALQDFGVLLKGRRVAPFELYDAARKSLHFVGYEGLSMIAAAGLDMASWDALAKAADLPLCVLLGGSVGPVRSYNSNGLWLKQPEAVAEEALELRDEGGFTGLKLRLGRERISDDLATLDAVRKAVGDEMHLMVDFNQGLNLAEALQRCHMIDDHGLAWIEEPIVYDNLDGYSQLAAELKTPLQIGENFYGPRDMHKALQKKACDLVSVCPASS